jgi:hypothetical protein
MFRKLSLLFGLALLAPLAAFAIACSDDDDGGSGAAADTPEEREVEATIRAVVDAYQAGDLQRFLSYWTDEGLQAEFESTRAEITQAGPEFFAGPAELSLRNVTDIDVSGDEASAQAELVFGKVLQPTEYELIRDANTWKINGSNELNARIPSGVTAVDVELDEFAFKFDKTKIKDGNVAFKGENVGEQPHEIALLKVPNNLTLEQFLQVAPALLASPTLPTGVEFVGGVFAEEPGDEANLVVVEPLEPGHYIMACFLPDQNDPEETPHALKGMVSDFNITTQGGN